MKQETLFRTSHGSPFVIFLNTCWLITATYKNKRNANDEALRLHAAFGQDHRPFRTQNGWVVGMNTGCAPSSISHYTDEVGSL
jgi:hypothetical protein